MPRVDLVQIRRGSTAEWAAANPVLADGEPGVDTDTGEIRVGDGVSTWSALPSTADNAIADLIAAAPAALDTLNELAAALGDDSNFAATVTTQLAGKADDADVTALDGRLDTVEDTAAFVYVHNGSTYVAAGGRIFIGPEDPAADGFTLVDGDQWEDTSA